MCVGRKHHTSPLTPAGGFEKEWNLTQFTAPDEITAVRPVPLPQQSSLVPHKEEEDRGDWQDFELPSPLLLSLSAAAHASLHQMLHWHIGAAMHIGVWQGAPVCKF